MTSSGHPLAHPQAARRAGLLARSVVWVGLLAVPTGTVRTRYSLEHTAELRSLPPGAQLRYALGAALSALALGQVIREIRTTDRETRYLVMRQWVTSGTWINAELRRRQKDDETGFLKAGHTFPPWLRAMWLPLVVIVVGLVLLLVGPAPGLGAFMMMGGALAGGQMALHAWLNK